MGKPLLQQVHARPFEGRSKFFLETWAILAKNRQKRVNIRSDFVFARFSNKHISPD